MTRRARDLLIDILRDEGITHVFGNQGSTEMPIHGRARRRAGHSLRATASLSPAAASANGAKSHKTAQ